ncbi:MAG: ParA family protein [Bacillota bacterium]
MKVLAVANRKGGVGKTTVAANLANEARRMGHLVVLVDMDPQCDLNKTYLRGGHDGPTVLDVLREECSAEDACVQLRENLYIIPGSDRLEHFGLKRSEGLLRQALGSDGLGEVDLVIIDTPPSVNEATLAAYTAADHVLLVTKPESFSLDNTDGMLETVRHVQATMNGGLAVVGIAVNMVDGRRGLAKALHGQLRRAYGGLLLNSYISYDAAVPASQHKGLPVRELHWRSRAVGQFRDLSLEVLERMGMLGGDGQAAGE